MASIVSATRCWAILSICGLVAASEMVSAQSVTLPKSPAPGFMRLPGQDVPSDFVLSPLRIPGASMDTDFAERTIVKFVRPMNVDLCSVDLTDPYLPAAWPQPRENRLGSDRDLAYRNLFRIKERIEAPGQHSFLQRRIHRLKLTDIDNDLSRSEIHVTMEVMAGHSKSREFLARNSIPVEFTNEDFKSVMEAGTVMKIFYLPNTLHMDDDESGSGVRVETHPGWAIEGVDPIHEARQRGSVLLVIRMGIGQIFSASLAASPQPSFSSAVGPFQFSLGPFR